MGIGPIAAIPKVLSQFGLSKEDVDVYEVRNFYLSFSDEAHWSMHADKRSVRITVRVLRRRAWHSNEQDQPKVWFSHLFITKVSDESSQWRRDSCNPSARDE